MIDRTRKVEPLPDCPCREVIEASRQLFPNKDVDETKLYKWGCPVHDPTGQVRGLAKMKVTKTDTELLSWLDEFLKTGCLETGFEFDGGIYATFRTPGYEDVVLRDKNSLRDILQELANDNPWWT